MSTMPPVADRWEKGDPYERYVGRWSRRVAPDFLGWLHVPPGKRWLDVGCGTGALTGAILEHCVPTEVTAVEPSEGFLAKARERLPERVALKQGTAAGIPLPDVAVDATVSALMLNFVPDIPAALREMHRVTAPRGVVAAYVWDYGGKMELMRRFWDAAVALDPAAAKLDEAVRFPICQPAALDAAFDAAGLREVATAALEIETRFESFDDYWQPFLGGQGPAPSYAMALDAAQRDRLRERILGALPLQADGSFSLVARAWAVRGEVP